MNETTKIELAKLEYYEKICQAALTEFAVNHPEELLAFEREKISEVLERMYSAERDYLIQSPSDYFDLYGESLNKIYK